MKHLSHTDITLQVRQIFFEGMVPHNAWPLHIASIRHSILHRHSTINVMVTFRKVRRKLDFAQDVAELQNHMLVSLFLPAVVRMLFDQATYTYGQLCTYM